MNGLWENTLKTLIRIYKVLQIITVDLSRIIIKYYCITFLYDMECLM